MINFLDPNTNAKYFYDAFLEMKNKTYIYFKLHGENNPLHESIRRLSIYKISTYDMDTSLSLDEQAIIAKNLLLNHLNIRNFEIYYYSNYSKQMKNSEFTAFEWLPNFSGTFDYKFDLNKIFTPIEHSTCKDANKQLIKKGDIVVGMTGRKSPYHQVVGTVELVFKEKYAIRNKERAKIKPLDCFKQFDRDMVIVDTTDIMNINNGMLSEIVAARLTSK